MTEENKAIWDLVRQPPKEALKQIRGGRLSGMTDIKPQWRYEIITDIFGPCGLGWKYDITKYWLEPASDGQVAAFVEIKFYYFRDDNWSEAIPGTGGSMFIAKEKSGLHTSDEAYKMAVTDALSVALKMLGVGADIYAGLWDGSKYKTVSHLTQKQTGQPEQKPPDQPRKQFKTTTETGFPPNGSDATAQQLNALYKMVEKQGLTNRELDEIANWYKVGDTLCAQEAGEMISDLQGIMERYMDYLETLKGAKP